MSRRSAAAIWHNSQALISLLFVFLAPSASFSDSIVFGSCIDQHGSQEFWKDIAAVGPDALFLLGDNVYEKSGDPTRIREAYAMLLKQDLVKRYLSQQKLFAVWDDNDYGAPDGGRDFRNRQASQKIFLETFQVPTDDPRWKRDGIYFSKKLELAGHDVRVILLDARSFRTALVPSSPGELGPYSATSDPNATVLGAAQWQWLERELREPAELILLVSSIQVLPTEHGYEKWGNFPAERERLLRMLLSSTAQVVILSGDRHHAELSRMTAAGKTLIELTAGAFNMDRPDGAEPNRYRLGSQVLQANFGVLDFDRKGLTISVRRTSRSGSPAKTILQKRLVIAPTH